MSTKSIIAAREKDSSVASSLTLAERIRAEKTDLEKIHDDLCIVSWELDKAMSPLRAIKGLEDAILNGEGKDAFQARLDAMNLADISLNAVVTINKQYGELLDHLEKVAFKISQEQKQCNH